jgi:hypothetical protein
MGLWQLGINQKAHTRAWYSSVVLVAALDNRTSHRTRVNDRIIVHVFIAFVVDEVLVTSHALHRKLHRR